MRPARVRRLWHVLGALLFGCATLTLSADGQATPQSSSPAPVSVAASHQGFNFVDVPCEQAPRICRGPILFRQWTSAETAVVIRALDELLAHPRAAGVVAAARMKGMSFLRMNIGRNGDTYISANMVPFPTGTGPSAVVELTDRFFEIGDRVDRRSGVRLQTLAILHELFHMLDLQRFDAGGRLITDSGSEGFLRISGLATHDRGWMFQLATVQDTIALVNVARRMEQFRRERRYSEEHELSRDYALGLSRGFPSRESIENPADAFAEFGAFYVLDPAARHYLTPAIVGYFEQRLTSLPLAPATQ